MSHMLQPGIILLREGADTSQGRGQVVSNINACQAIVDTVRTTLGPRGMDKLIMGPSTMVITNDGATVLNQLDVVHPAPKTLVEIAKSQDSEVGDGTTSVVILAGEFLSEAKRFVEEGVHPQAIIKGYRKASNMARERLRQIQVTFTAEDTRRYLETCAATSLQSKLIASNRAKFSKMVVDSVLHLDEDLDISMIGIKKESGGSIDDSFLVEGVSFKKTFSYAGFEQQPKSFTDPKILCLNLELELKQEKENAEIRITDPAKYQEIVDAEWTIIYDKLDSIVRSGANIVLSRIAIGDLATQYFADRQMFCAGRVTDEDLKRVCRATGAQVQTTVSNLTPTVLGTCGKFEEKQIGKERYNLFTGCSSAKSCTIVLRGGGEHFIDEAERSLHDAIMIVRRAIKHNSVVAGGGAIEMELSKYLRDYSLTVSSKEQMIIAAYARALEVIPRQLADNAGFDSTTIINQLRQKHAQATGGTWFGVDINNEGICDTMLSNVWEPSLVKLNAIAAATEAAALVLSVDQTIRNAPSEKPMNKPLPGPGRGRGMPMRGGMRGGRR
ncbi:Tcomplex protein 1, eta subunit [Pelomyxa schiedti]|nr:Tcomplex protein 1, eta subunit [Pelomyxa schiedti]